MERRLLEISGLAAVVEWWVPSALYLGGCSAARRFRRRKYHWPIVMQSSGQLKFTPAGLIWRRKQGSKVVEVKKDGKGAQTVPALALVD